MSTIGDELDLLTTDAADVLGSSVTVAREVVGAYTASTLSRARTRTESSARCVAMPTEQARTLSGGGKGANTESKRFAVVLADIESDLGTPSQVSAAEWSVVQGGREYRAVAVNLEGGGRVVVFDTERAA